MTLLMSSIPSGIDAGFDPNLISNSNSSISKNGGELDQMTSQNERETYPLLNKSQILCKTEQRKRGSSP